MSRDNDTTEEHDTPNKIEGLHSRIIVPSKDVVNYQALSSKLSEAAEIAEPFIVVGATGLAKIWRKEAFPSDQAQLLREPLFGIQKKLSWWKSAPSKAVPVALVGARNLGARVTNFDIIGRVQGRDRDQKVRQEALAKLPIIGILTPMNWTP